MSLVLSYPCCLLHKLQAARAREGVGGEIPPETVTAQVEPKYSGSSQKLSLRSGDSPNTSDFHCILQKNLSIHCTIKLLPILN